MEISSRERRVVSFLMIMLLCFQIHLNAQENLPYVEIPVGVILDMGSWVGNTIYRCITMAVSDFYTVNSRFKTRIVLHSRDTQGQPLHALSAALDLLEKRKVQAIIGSESAAEAKFLSVLGDEARVPILSLSPTSYSKKHPYFLQITQDEITQFKAISAMAESFKWKNVILICEDTDIGRDMATFMRNVFQEKSITIAYKSLISTSASNELVQKELNAILTMQTKIYIMHTSHSLASNIFINAKYLGMMEIYTYGIWASDAVSALAMAIERTQVLKSNIKDFKTSDTIQRGTSLLDRGLGGSFQPMNGKSSTQLLQIINVIGKGERRVGIWTKDVDFTRKIGKMKSFSDIIRPGGISTSPTHRMLLMSNKTLRIGIPVRFREGGLFQVKSNEQTNSTDVSGFCVEVFRASITSLDPDIALEFIPFMQKAEVGKVNYNDLIYGVYDGEFDAVVGDITITANRSKYVDFTLPFTDLGLATLSRNVDASRMWIFMEPLSSDLWVVSACFFILLGFVIWILEHRTNEEFQGSPIEQIGTTLWFAFSTIVYAHRQKLQSNLSRFVVTVWLFVVLVLVSSYVATLSSLLTVEQIQLASKRGSIGYQDGSAVQEVIVRNMNFKDTRLKRYSSPVEYANALSRGSKNDGVDAIVDEIPYIKEFLALYPSGYTMTLSEDITNGFGFVFPLSSPLAPLISSQIVKLREDGTLKMLEKTWFNPQSKDFAPSQKVLNFKGLRGLFLISGVSMAAALFLFMLYYIHEKFHFTYMMLAGGKLAFIMKLLVAKSGNSVERKRMK